MSYIHIELYDKKFRDKRWRKCRFGLDPRNCGRSGKEWPENVTSLKVEKGVNVCMRDGKPCDVKWEESPSA